MDDMCADLGLPQRRSQLRLGRLVLRSRNIDGPGVSRAVAVRTTLVSVATVGLVLAACSGVETLTPTGTAVPVTPVFGPDKLLKYVTIAGERALVTHAYEE